MEEGRHMSMKLVIAVAQDEDADDLLTGLHEEGFSATQICSSGGLLRGGNTTVLIGVEEKRVNAVRDIIRRYCRRRTELALPYSPAMEPALLYVPERFEVEVGGAIIFVRPIERFVQLP